jgi:hypothetical protein
VRANDLWRMRYDALLKESEELKLVNRQLRSKLTVTIIAFILSIIYSLIKGI